MRICISHGLSTLQGGHLQLSPQVCLTPEKTATSYSRERKGCWWQRMAKLLALVPPWPQRAELFGNGLCSLTKLPPQWENHLAVFVQQAWEGYTDQVSSCGTLEPNCRSLFLYVFQFPGVEEGRNGKFSWMCVHPSITIHTWSQGTEGSCAESPSWNLLFFRHFKT